MLPTNGKPKRATSQEDAETEGRHTSVSFRYATGNLEVFAEPNRAWGPKCEPSDAASALPTSAVRHRWSLLGRNRQTAVSLTTIALHPASASALSGDVASIARSASSALSLGTIEQVFRHQLACFRRSRAGCLLDIAAILAQAFDSVIVGIHWCSFSLPGCSCSAASVLASAAGGNLARWGRRVVSGLVRLSGTAWARFSLVDRDSSLGRLQ